MMSSVLWIWMLLVYNTGLSYVSGQGCPYDATSCCQCVQVPGCSWIQETNESPARCTDSPFLNPNHNSSTLRSVTPSALHELILKRNQPVARERGVLIEPQAAKISLALGARFELPVKIVALTNHQRLVLKYPSDGPAVSLGRAADGLSCDEGLRAIQSRSRGGGRRGGGGRRSGGNRRTGRRHQRGRRREGARVDRAATRTRNRSRGGRGHVRNQRPTSVRKDKYECRGSLSTSDNHLILVVNMTKCLPPGQRIKLGVKGAGRYKMLKVNIESLCNCPCSGRTVVSDVAASRPGSRSSYCRHGSMPCGLDPTTYESDPTTYESDPTTYESDPTCYGASDRCQVNSSSPICSGHGQCVCGMCECNFDPTSSARYYGQFCECNDATCPSFMSQPCGGPSRGICQCGQCVCREGYTGANCELSLQTDTCRAPGASQSMLCSGHGQCLYGRCRCEDPYAGRYCEECPTCPSLCGQLRPCVECMLFGDSNPSRSQPCAERCFPGRQIQYQMVDALREEDTQCIFADINDPFCLYQFSYQPSGQFPDRVFVKTNIECRRNN